MKDFVLIIPEMMLILTLAFIVIGEITYHDERIRLIPWISVLGLGAALIETLLSYRLVPSKAFGAALSVDAFALFFKLFFILLAGFGILSAMLTREIPDEKKTEYCAFILATSTAMCLVASAADLFLAGLSLLFVNLAAFFLIGFGKRDLASTEAAVKFLLFSILSTVLFFYGVGILFAHTASVDLYEVHKVLGSNPLSDVSMRLVFFLFFLALCFQWAAFPMHFWAPDVLGGAPTPVSAYISVGSRTAGFALALRLFIVLFALPTSQKPVSWNVLGTMNWPLIMAWVGGLTMLIGSFLALRQERAKRMIGCLVVSQAGYLMMGLLVLDKGGMGALLYNLVIELFTLMGSFSILAFIYDWIRSDRFHDLRGLLKQAVPECICLILFLLSLVGVPPMPGFIGKFTLIGAAIHHEWLILGMVAISSIAVSTVAIARFAYFLAGDFKMTSMPHFPGCWSRKALLTLFLLPLVFVGIFAEAILSWTSRSLDFILW